MNCLYVIFSIWSNPTMECIGINADIPSSYDNVEKFGSLVRIILNDENAMRKGVLKCYKALKLNNRN